MILNFTPAWFKQSVLQRFAGNGEGSEKERESKKFLRFLFNNKRILCSTQTILCNKKRLCLQLQKNLFAATRNFVYSNKRLSLQQQKIGISKKEFREHEVFHPSQPKGRTQMRARRIEFLETKAIQSAYQIEENTRTFPNPEWFPRCAQPNFCNNENILHARLHSSKS